MTRLENNTKPEKPKPVRRKTVADNFIAPLLDSKSTQYPATKGMHRAANFSDEFGVRFGIG